MSETRELTYSTKERKQPIGVTIDGERFVMSPVPGVVFAEFLRMSMQPDPEDAREKAAKELRELDALLGIFDDVMEDAEFERFTKFCRSPRGPDVMTLVQIIEDVVAASANFPTSPPSHSPPGQSSTGAGSTDDVSSQDSTSSVSLSDGSSA